MQYGNYPNPDLCKKYGCYRERTKFLNMGCPGCEQQQQFKNQQLQAVIKEATDYAKEQNIPFAIYQEAGEYKCIRYDLAAGLPVLQIVSQFA